MGDLFVSYPYLWTSVAMLLVAMLLISRSPLQRRSLLAAGTIGMLFGIFSFEFIPWYWDPPVTMHFVASPEDLLFSFATGTIVWWLALRAAAGPIEMELETARVALRTVMFAVPGIAISYGIGIAVDQRIPLVTTLISVSVMGLVFLWFKRTFWLAAAVSALVFCLFYLLVMKLSFYAWPGFLQAWHTGDSPPLMLFGVPVFELGWALGYGLVFPLYLLVVFDARQTAGNRGFEPAEAPSYSDG